MSFNDRFTEERRQLCPHREILDKSIYYDFGDCPDYGCSDCNIAMEVDNVCLMDKKDLEETLCYKYK